MIKKISIRIKIVLPYTLLLVIFTALVSIITINLIYKRIDERIEGQMDHAIGTISSMGFLLNDEFLARSKISDVIGADIIVYNPNGEVAATNLPRDRLNEIMPVINLPDTVDSISHDLSLIRDIRLLNKPYKVIYRQIEDLNQKNRLIFSLIVSTEDIDETKRQSAMTIIIVAISGVMLVTAIGSLIAFSITAPVKELVQITERVASGDLTAFAKVKTRDEIGILAQSFNQMTSELKVSRDRLVQSERLAVLGQLTASIAHEIRNPLTSMKMIVQILKRKLHDDESSKESLQVVLDEIDRLNIIVSSLLDSARPIELNARQANIIEAMNEVIRLMDPNIRHRNIEISVIKQSENVPETMIDVERMKQVFMNIIINAMQAMPKGGTIIVKYDFDANNNEIAIEISDTGVGMSEEVLKHVYDPFFSAKSSGTGLGLTNAKKILDLHDANIQIESVEGQGTLVRLRVKGYRKKYDGN
ncbi:MAG: ATP-binding protein [Candidatus Poribacteria bacterium]